eukprot:1842009-Alexandrium_andersonii.AAC.1
MGRRASPVDLRGLPDPAHEPVLPAVQDVRRPPPAHQADAMGAEAAAPHLGTAGAAEAFRAADSGQGQRGWQEGRQGQWQGQRHHQGQGQAGQAPHP